ncbi:MAG: hypothetical protein M1827_005848 [Pycnora praestabilis]|nr:MAG: hypothetical protein M1827_005848 [Pycnora praestabilis]
MSTASVIWTLLSMVVMVAAQTLAASNETISSNGGLQLLLRTNLNGMTATMNVAPLTTAAGLDQTQGVLNGLHIDGTLVLTTSPNVNNLNNEDLAFLSCDKSAYSSGMMDASSVFNIATGKDPMAVVLYSTEVSNCNFTAGEGNEYNMIFTMTSSTASQQLENNLKSNSDTESPVNIILDTSNLPANSTGNGTESGSSANNGDPLGPSPTTAVAMIILYSITGVITALFLIIIITGAVRAHRHPERYGPRNIVGRARQSRAKGIARAMLETLPIVKFGENQPDKPAGQDVELGSTNGSARTRENGEQPVGEGETPAYIDATEHGSAPVAPAAGAMSEQIETIKDEGLGCSICTDDFVKGQDIRVLPCDHKFHPECIDPWLLNVSGTCPLCRVDLRPTVSNTADATATTEDGITAANGTSNALPPPLTEAENGNVAMNRPRNGLSSYLQHTLNTRRMHDATPEERVAALRRLRTVARANQAESSTNNDARRSNRLSGVFRDAFRIKTRRSDIPVAAADGSNQSQPEAEEEVREAATEERRRTGTFSG